MRIIPVIDLLGGQVVHAVGGQRSEYRPIRSSLCPGSTPVEIAQAFRNWFGLNEIYLADLDAIAGGRGDFDDCINLRRDGFSLWVDRGVRRGGDAQVFCWDDINPVLGLETLQGPDVLAEVLRGQGEHILFSLDLREGQPLGSLQGWKWPTAWGIAAEAVALGVKRLLVLDLASVGMLAGTATEDLCAALVASYPSVEILAGGGVRGRSDLLRLQQTGVSAVLVASALHDGRLTRRDIEGLQESGRTPAT